MPRSSAAPFDVNVLAIDTSGPVGSVGVWRDTHMVAELSGVVRARHGETLMPRIDQTMRMAELNPGDLQLVVIGVGPGSFTGVRVGVATGKSLSLSLGVPVVGVSSLRALARSVAVVDWPVAVVVDAQRGEMFGGVYEPASEGPIVNRLAPERGTPDAVVSRLLADTDRPLVWVGDALGRYPEAFARLPADHRKTSVIHGMPRAAALAEEGLLEWRAHGATNIDELEPVYARPCDAEVARLETA